MCSRYARAHYVVVGESARAPRAMTYTSLRVLQSSRNNKRELHKTRREVQVIADYTEKAPKAP